MQTGMVVISLFDQIIFHGVAVSNILENYRSKNIAEYQQVIVNTIETISQLSNLSILDFGMWILECGFLNNLNEDF